MTTPIAQAAQVAPATVPTLKAKVREGASRNKGKLTLGGLVVAIGTIATLMQWFGLTITAGDAGATAPHRDDEMAGPPKPRLLERVTDLEIGAETARSRLDIVERAAAGEHIAREAMVAEQRNLGMAQIRLDGRLDTMDARIGHIEAEGPVRHLEVLDALKELRQDLRDNRRAR